MKELTKFFFSSKFAFHKVEELQNLIKIDKEAKSFLELHEFDTKPSGVNSFKRNSVLNLEITLYQQTIVRAISALEVFLIDTFRDVFIINKTPFKDDSKFHQFSQSHILSLKSTSELFNYIINKECRNLSQGGFSEIIKAYKKKLKIDLLHIAPGKQKMIEYHEIRHLIVHKLGRTDIQFRNKYNAKDKAGISINNEYCVNCLKDISNFAKQTHSFITKKLNEEIITDVKNTSVERKIKYIVEIIENFPTLDFLNPDYEFWVNDEFEVLKNILIDKKSLDDNKIELFLGGTKRQIKAYHKNLKYAKNKQLIKFTINQDNYAPIIGDRIENSQEGINYNKRKPIHIEEETIELIRQLLPEQPWAKGTHKIIADELGLSTKIVTTTIQVLIKRGFFKQQIDGILIENKKLKL